MRYARTLLAGGILLAALAASFFILRHSREESLPVAQARDMILARAKLDIPEIQSTVPLSYFDVPQEFTFLIKENGVEKLNLRTVTYMDNRSGYLLVVTFQGSLLQSYNRYSALLGEQGWQSIHAARHDSQFALREVENSTYVLRSTFIPVSSNATQVTIQIVSK